MTHKNSINRLLRLFKPLLVLILFGSLSSLYSEEKNKKHKSNTNNTPLSYAAHKNKLTRMPSPYYEIRTFDETVPHSPFSSACSELVSYYNYFMEHLMSDKSQTKNRERLGLICSVLSLSSTLADKNFRHVRTEELAEKLTDLVRTMAHLQQVEKQTRGRSGSEPLFSDIDSNTYLHKLLSLEADTSNPDNQIEVGVYAQSILRAESSASVLLKEIFKTLSTNAKEKFSFIVNDFHHETEKLFEHKVIHPIERKLTRSHEKPHEYDHTQVGREYRQNAMVFAAAAHACEDIEVALPHDRFYEGIYTLLKLTSSFFSAISSTYESLSHKSEGVKQSERKTIATHIAHMIREVDRAEHNPLLFAEDDQLTRSPNKNKPTKLLSEVHRDGKAPKSVYLEKCLSLPSQSEQEIFVQEMFENKLDRSGLFDEFVPHFKKCLNSAIDQVTGTLKEYTSTMFEENTWFTPKEDEGRNIVVVYDLKKKK